EVAIAVAIAVGKQAYAEGLTTGVTADTVEAAVHARMWTPRYATYCVGGAAQFGKPERFALNSRPACGVADRGDAVELGLLARRRLGLLARLVALVEHLDLL